ncbi:MAG: LPXTG cell wall anchor domain-containing protein [Chlorobi bacterium]|nr:LPXTG cell wall anchor domain-containing protein [Chlorobiota bacterium]
MKKLVLVLVIGMFMAVALPFGNISAQDPAAADSLSADVEATPLYNPEEEAQEPSEDSNTLVWVAIGVVVVVGGYLAFKKKK